MRASELQEQAQEWGLKFITIRDLQKKGVWVYCADMQGQPWCAADYSGGVALVVGSEGQGVSRIVRESCDAAVSLPMLGKVNSLNASVAAGVILYEIARQRQGLQARTPKPRG